MSNVQDYDVGMILKQIIYQTYTLSAEVAVIDVRRLSWGKLRAN